MKLIKIILPEGDNPNIIVAAERAAKKKTCQPVLIHGSDALAQAADMLARGEVDGMVAGIDHTTRDVILATRDRVGMADDNKTFCSLFVFEFSDGRKLIMADGGVVKNPTTQQLADIINLTHDAAKPTLGETPRVACLSFSTFGSGGRDDSITKIQKAIAIVKERRSDIIIDGEMQLDAAVNAEIGKKKAPDSLVAGRANVLIAPDLNSGNILYKSIEQFGGAHAYGPVLLGFAKPVSDLSRGSTADDVYGCIKIVTEQAREKAVK